MEFLQTLGMVIMTAIYMAFYYVTMFLFGGVLIYFFLVLVDAMCKTDFSGKWKRWLSGVEDWRKSLTKDNQRAKPSENPEWQSA